MSRTKKPQHTSPCKDCPWRRKALRGWLGDLGEPEAWIEVAAGEARVECHSRTGFQCAGIAIFRANICKLPRYPEILRLKPDTDRVFATREEFIEHHTLRQSTGEGITTFPRHYPKSE